jgi:hypothetical protein
LSFSFLLDTAGEDDRVRPIKINAAAQREKARLTTEIMVGGPSAGIRIEHSYLDREKML